MYILPDYSGWSLLAYAVLWSTEILIAFTCTDVDLVVQLLIHGLKIFSVNILMLLRLLM